MLEHEPSQNGYVGHVKSYRAIQKNQSTVKTQRILQCYLSESQNTNFFNCVEMARSERRRLHNAREPGSIPTTGGVFFLRSLMCHNVPFPEWEAAISSPAPLMQ